MSNVQILNLTQHVATNEQKEAGVIDVSPEHRQALTDALTINYGDSLKRKADEVLAIASYYRCQAVMIGGAPFFMAGLAAELEYAGYEVLFAFSERESVEVTAPDGSIQKRSVFRHKGFVTQRGQWR